MKVKTFVLALLESTRQLDDVEPEKVVPAVLESVLIAQQQIAPNHPDSDEYFKQAKLKFESVHNLTYVR